MNGLHMLYQGKTSLGSRILRTFVLAGLLLLAAVVIWVWVAYALQPGDAPSDCPTAGAGQQVLLVPEGGYCLLYPAEYTWVQPVPGTVELVIGSAMNHVQPRVSIRVSDAAGQSLDQVEEQLEADHVPPDWGVVPQSITADGVAGVMLDNLPGQDLNRRVVFLHDGRLYTLFLAPLGDKGSETREQAERLYRQVLDSFLFLDAG